MSIKDEAEKILKDAVILYSKLNQKKISNEEIKAMLMDILRNSCYTPRLKGECNGVAKQSFFGGSFLSGEQSEQ